MKTGYFKLFISFVVLCAMLALPYYLNSQMQEEVVPAVEEMSCEYPFMDWNEGCCLDENNNSECDSQEVEEEIIEEVEEVVEEDPVIEPVMPEPTYPVNDTIKPLIERTYYWDGESFGVGSATYGSHFPVVSSAEWISIEALNLGVDFVDLQIDTHLSKPHLVRVYVNDSHTTSTGVRITPYALYSSTFTYALEMTTPETYECESCLAYDEDIYRHGMKIIEDNRVSYFTYRGEQQSIEMVSTNPIRLQVDGQLLPALPEGETFVMRNGLGITFHFGSQDGWNAKRGYAVYSLFETTDLPLLRKCTNCTHVEILEENKTYEVYLDGAVRELSITSDFALTFDDTTVELIEDTEVTIDETFSAYLFEDSFPAQIGLVQGTSRYSFVCRESTDKGYEYTKAGSIDASFGAGIEFGRRDTCLDDSTLIEYDCRQVKEEKNYATSGKGMYPSMRLAECDCMNGRCLEPPETTTLI